MASVQSVLIRTCMSTIQKELFQLEDWLLRVPSQSNVETLDPSGPTKHGLYISGV